MVCVLPEVGVYILFSSCGAQDKINAGIFEGSRVFVNAFHRNSSHDSP